VSVKTPYITVGLDNNGEMDFEVYATMGDLSLDQMNELRQTIPVAICTAENMYRTYGYSGQAQMAKGYSNENDEKT